MNLLSPSYTQGMQDATSPMMKEILCLHDYVNFILVFIISFVLYIMISISLNTFMNKMLLQNQFAEYVWTIIPSLVLSQIAGPSIMLLYLLDEALESTLTIKAAGHQWYWNYDYSDFWAILMTPLEFDSYMIPEELLDENLLRLLEVDNRTVIPYETHIRVLVSSTDVLHAWTIPVLGVKVDAIPGRLNQLKFICQRPGIFYGQCSEICGANHSFMPIVIEAVDTESFLNWILSQLND